MFPRTECCENREDEKCECHAALPPGESARIPPHHQHPCHVKRGHGIWRTNDLHGFHEQARYIGCWNWLPRKLLPKEMYGPKGWKEIVKENADRSGGQQGHKGWHCFFTQADEQTLSTPGGYWRDIRTRLREAREQNPKPAVCEMHPLPKQRGRPE